MAATPPKMLTLASMLLACALAAPGVAQDKTVEDGKYMDKDETPTYNVGQDGTVDWYTFSGFRRYHAECHVCHGPDGLGSTYAPNLAESIKRGVNFEQFQEVIANGRQQTGATGNSVMPAFGTNRNVMCYIEDIWVYLRARADEAVPRGRPAKREPQPNTAKEYETACMGQ